MIIGLTTLIAILFFGGVSETFLVDKLDKGVKKYVIEKERKKEITADLREAKKYIKAFNKERKKQFKTFQEMNTDKNISRVQMEEFFVQLMKDRRVFEDRVIEDRISISAKLRPGEWDAIMDYSRASVNKTKTKSEKKVAKGKFSEPFEKTFEVIEKDIADSVKLQNVRNALTTFVESQKRTVSTLLSMNSVDSNILSKQKASRDELKDLAENLNVHRKKAFDDLVEFHYTVVEQTTDEDWAKVMKSFNKELSITSH
jgi:hypothetical protein